MKNCYTIRFCMLFVLYPSSMGLNLKCFAYRSFCAFRLWRWMRWECNLRVIALRRRAMEQWTAGYSHSTYLWQFLVKPLPRSCINLQHTYVQRGDFCCKAQHRISPMVTNRSQYISNRRYTGFRWPRRPEWPPCPQSSPRNWIPHDSVMQASQEFRRPSHITSCWCGKPTVECLFEFNLCAFYQKE
jgi:hypothetical protein